MAIPFIIVGSVLLWRRMIVPLALKHYRWHKQHHATEKYILLRRANIPPSSSVGKLCATSLWLLVNTCLLVPMARAVLAIDHHILLIQRKEKVYGHHHCSGATWRAMNTPLVLHRGSQILATPIQAIITNSYLGQLAKMHVHQGEIDHAAVIKQLPKRIRDLSLQHKLSKGENMPTKDLVASGPDLTEQDKRTSELNLRLFGVSHDRSEHFVRAMEAAEETNYITTAVVDENATKSNPAAQIYNNNYGTSSAQAEVMLRSIMRLYRKNAARERSLLRRKQSKKQPIDGPLPRQPPSSKEQQQVAIDGLLLVTELSSAMTSMWANQHRLQHNPKLSVAEQREFMQAFYAWVMTQKPGAEKSVSAVAFANWFRTRYGWLANRQRYR